MDGKNVNYTLKNMRHLTFKDTKTVLDTAMDIVNEASEQFAPIWQINSERLQIFQQYCEALDALAKQYNVEAIEVGVNERNHTIDIQLECISMEVENKKHVFYELAERALSFGFEHSENGNLIVKFVFPSLWT